MGAGVMDFPMYNHISLLSSAVNIVGVGWFFEWQYISISFWTHLGDGYFQLIKVNQWDDVEIIWLGTVFRKIKTTCIISLCSSVNCSMHIIGWCRCVTWPPWEALCQIRWWRASWKPWWPLHLPLGWIGKAKADAVESRSVVCARPKLHKQ